MINQTFQTNAEMKTYLKRYKKACIHFCGVCWLRFTCGFEDRKNCKANKKETCDKCAGKILTDKELEEIF